ncbi:hypothetical protein CIPAW_13G145600 [Carya illinoinensis]|uniref:C2H2-type domain-containing protein n=1 Tax=Carya illinoinensis TaxID=32201 RepID=A0A8T1NPE8_CARIL|nr:hypothetical protein CIPAW_13G145600 [Carya illinoinensis]
MDIDAQENQFEGDSHVPIEEMEKLKEFTFSGTILDNDDQDGKPKAIKESRRDTRDDHHLNLRICDLCGKTFSGGKALGGHRRSHFQTKKAVGLSKNIKKSVAGADLRMDYHLINGYRCRICDKDFQSMQSLSGHMRLHPERSWRGIQPPILPSRRNSISSSSTSDSADDHNITSTDKRMAPNVDLLKSLSNWSQTDRRGRGNIGCAWAAEIIMSFSREKDSPIPIHSVLFMDQRVDPSAVVPEEQSMKKLKTVSCTDQRVDASAVVEEQRMTKLKIHGSGTSGRKEDEEKKIAKKNIAEGGMPDEHFKDRYQIGQKKMNKKKTLKCWEESLIRNSEMEEVDHDLIDRTQKMPYCYECTDCGKSFPTFQALGGHRSSHNKDKMQKSNASSHEAASAGDQEKTSANINHRSWYQTVGVAETPLKEGASPAEANSTPSAAKIASPKEASTSTDHDQCGARRLTMGFDLNYKPHFMEDHEYV